MDEEGIKKKKNNMQKPHVSITDFFRRNFQSLSNFCSFILQNSFVVIVNIFIPSETFINFCDDYRIYFEHGIENNIFLFPFSNGKEGKEVGNEFNILKSFSHCSSTGLKLVLNLILLRKIRLGNLKTEGNGYTILVLFYRNKYNLKIINIKSNKTKEDNVQLNLNLIKLIFKNCSIN
ncbi:hypothetical protein Avbf_15122 [Armadillidium vulgare]|nr:hypothetical protein Avbf_15122 [Armadillidium vulgare]